MNLSGYDHAAELETSFMVDLPPERVYQLLKGEAGMTYEGVVDAIDESPSGAPGTVWRLRVQSGGSECWIRSRVVVDEPPVRLDLTCSSGMSFLRRFETTCSYVLRPVGDGGTHVDLTVQTPVGAGNVFLPSRSESQLRERLDIGARQWAARVSGERGVPPPEPTARRHRKLAPLTILAVGVLVFFATRLTRSYLVVTVGGLFGWIALLVANRHSGSVTTRPVVRPRAPRVRTIGQVRFRRGLMVAISIAFGVVTAIGSHRWQNTVTAVVVASVLQWLGVRFVAIVRRWTVA